MKKKGSPKTENRSRIGMPGDESRTVVVKRGKSLALLNVLCAVLLILGILLAARLVTNRLFLRDYDQGEFVDEREEGLLRLNFPERYLPYYNLGNAAFKRGDYKEAVVRYEQALARHPGIYQEEKDCRVRINLALSMVKQLDLDDLDSEEKVADAVKVLLAARDILTENGCANPQAGVFDGHSEDAEQLKKEIDELLKKLTDPDSQPDQQDQEEEKEPEDQKDQKNETNREKELRKKMEEQMSQSAQEKADAQHQKDRQEDEESSGGGSGPDNGANW